MFLVRQLLDLGEQVDRPARLDTGSISPNGVEDPASLRTSRVDPMVALRAE
jgi:hypothetical protein